MKYLLSLFLGCLFVVACNCDEPYCPYIEETIININYSDDFSLGDLRSSKVFIVDTVRNVVVDSMFMIPSWSTHRNTSIEYYYELPSMDNIFVLNFNDFSDTIRDFYYDTNQTTYTCNSGCIIPDYSTIDLTEINNFYFTYNGDTIRDKTVFIEK